MEQPSDNYKTRYSQELPPLDGIRLSRFAHAILQRYGEPRREGGLATPEITTTMADSLRIISPDFHAPDRQSYTYCVNGRASVGRTTYLTRSDHPTTYVNRQGGAPCTPSDRPVFDMFSLITHLWQIPHATEPTINPAGEQQFKLLASFVAVEQAVEDKQINPRYLTLSDYTKFGRDIRETATKTALHQGIEVGGVIYPYSQSLWGIQAALSHAAALAHLGDKALPSAPQPRQLPPTPPEE